VKIIRNACDLAIHGATPAFEQPLHVGRPNIGDRERYLQLAGEMLDRRWLTNDGPLVREFEERLAEYLGVKHAVVMCNGTIALEIAIRALGLSGEIIVPSYTFIATAHAIHWQGITPIFVDIDPSTHNVDLGAVQRAITPRTTGIIGVHLWGRPAPIRGLEELCASRGLKLIFDAAHAFGVSSGNRMVGSFGNCEVFSFHATKFLNSLEGGAVTTSDDGLAESMRLMRNFGFSGPDNVIHPGTNGKMVECCAAMGLVNLASISSFIAANKQNYRAYAEGLAGLPGVRLLSFDTAEKNNWQYVVVEIGEEFGVSRDDIIQGLHAENILARRYFWPGCHKMLPYRDLYPWADHLLPNTNVVANRVIVLPTGTAVDQHAVTTICAVFWALRAAAAKTAISPTEAVRLMG
jgi:dTDP-4-amino-4,6-dideoxygalactose transaminase